MTIYTASMKVPNRGNSPSGSQFPWIDPWIMIQANNAAMAGKILYTARQASRGAMGLGSKI
jgi:hypothetical protein